MNRLNRTIAALVAWGMVPCAHAAAEGRAPDGLMLEFCRGPTVVEVADPTPDFGWVVHATRRNDRQTAYRVLVASDLALLQEDRADLWDSGKVTSSASTYVSYRGQPLAAGGTYCWKVKTWCERGGESPWSAPQRFTMGALSSDYATTRQPLHQTRIAPVRISRKAEGHYLVDFGKVAFGYLRLKLNSVTESGNMEVHFGERGSAEGVNRNPGGTVRYYKVMQALEEGANTLDVRPPRDGRNTGGKAIKLPPEIGVIAPFRYVELVHCPVALEASMIRKVAVHYPFDETCSAFDSSSRVLNDIWALCKYSMKATSFCGVYVDGDRERIPYEADAYINQLSHYAVDREYALARYSHEYLLDHPTWPTEWLQHSVLMAWADFMYTGNKESLAHHYELLKAKKTLEHRARPDGLLNTKGMRDIVDWPRGERDGYDFRPVNTVVNAFYYKTLLQMSDIAAALGKETDASGYRTKAAQVRTVFNEVFWDAGRGVYVDGEGSTHAALHANMMPLAFGLVPEGRRKSVTDYVVSRGMACSVYGAQYLLEALYEGGRPDAALERMTSKDIRSWYNMLRVGSTITLEAWDNRFKPNQDWNHAWGAVPGNIIPRYLLGLRPLTPGFGKVLARPMPGSLERASGTIPTIRGPVLIALRNEPGRPFGLDLELPANMTARVEIPLPGDREGITVDGQPVTAKVEQGYAVVDDVGSGRHTFATVDRVKSR